MSMIDRILSKLDQVAPPATATLENTAAAPTAPMSASPTERRPLPRGGTEAALARFLNGGRWVMWGQRPRRPTVDRGPP